MCEQGVAPYVAQSAPKVNFNVGSGNILATARTMDLPPQLNKGHEPRGNDFGERSQEQPMNIGRQQDVPPYAAQGAPKVNFNVQRENMKTICIPSLCGLCALLVGCSTTKMVKTDGMRSLIITQTSDTQ